MSAMLHTRRPGEVVVIAKTRTLVSDRAMRRGYYDNPSWGLEAHEPTIIPSRCLKPGNGTEKLEILGVDEGVLPPLIDVGDSRDRMLWRKKGGAPDPGPDRPTLIAMARQRYGDYSLADSVIDLVCAGWDEKDAAAELIPLYDTSFLKATVKDRPWTRRAADLIATGR